MCGPVCGCARAGPDGASSSPATASPTRIRYLHPSSRGLMLDSSVRANAAPPSSFHGSKTIRAGTIRPAPRCDGRWRSGVSEAYDHGMARWGRADAGGLGREALAYADTLYNLARYLFRILRNTFLSQYRHERHNPTVGGLDTVAPTAQGVEPVQWLRGDLELDRLRKVVGEEIERALMTLSEEARTVILLDLEGLTEVEVALVLGCPIGTVKSRLSRARAALRALLKDYAR